MTWRAASTSVRPSPPAQVELHTDDVPFLDYIISDIHGHLQVFSGGHSNVTLSGNGTRTIFRGYVTASMPLDGVKVGRCKRSIRGISG
jgi:hypothetical protein